MDGRQIVLLCGVNGAGKSTASATMEGRGYRVLDVDANNFDTSQLVSRYYIHFAEYLRENGVAQIMAEDEFTTRFNEYYRGECNRDASLTIFSIYRDITGWTGNHEAMEIKIDEIYKKVLAPVYEENTILNIDAFLATPEGLAQGKILVDVGSRKFFFINAGFLENLKERGFNVSIIYLDVDLGRNVSNLLGIRNGKYVLFDRLNFTCLVKKCLEELSLGDVSDLVSEDKVVREEAFRTATAMIEGSQHIKNEVIGRMSEYLRIRKLTLGEHLGELCHRVGKEVAMRVVEIGRHDTEEMLSGAVGAVCGELSFADVPLPRTGGVLLTSCAAASTRTIILGGAADHCCVTGVPEYQKHVNPDAAESIEVRTLQVANRQYTPGAKHGNGRYR